MDKLLREKMKHPWSLKVSIHISLYFSSNYTAERCFRPIYEVKVKTQKRPFQALSLLIITLHLLPSVEYVSR